MIKNRDFPSETQAIQWSGNFKKDERGEKNTFLTVYIFIWQVSQCLLLICRIQTFSFRLHWVIFLSNRDLVFASQIRNPSNQEWIQTQLGSLLFFSAVQLFWKRSDRLSLSFSLQVWSHRSKLSYWKKASRGLWARKVFPTLSVFLMVRWEANWLCRQPDPRCWCPQLIKGCNHLVPEQWAKKRPKRFVACS